MAHNASPTLSPRDDTFVRRWLRRHGGDRVPTPLLAARLRARRRGEQIELAAITTVVMVFAALALWQAWSTGSPGAAEAAPPDTAVALIGAGYVVLQLGSLLAIRSIHQADLHLADGLQHRVAHPAATGVVRRLGGWFVLAAAITYGGGILLTGIAAGFAGHPTDRAVATVFLCSLLLFAVSGLALISNVLRRPAVAEDARSLVDDEVLRREDAHRAIMPLPAMLALIAAVASRSGDLLLLAYLGYAGLTGLSWAVSQTITRRRPAGQAPATAGPAR